jgi:hypothetical protein
VRKGDLEILEEIIQSRGSFGHREHLELAWTYLRLYPVAEAAGVMTAAVQHVARRHGVEDKYHETITRAWLQFVAVHMRAGVPKGSRHSSRPTRTCSIAN